MMIIMFSQVNPHRYMMYDDEVDLQRLNFHIKNNSKLVSLSMLLKISKNSTKSKAVSSYMLSGINIKRMIQDEMASSENNASDISIIRVSKRPIFRLKEKDREKDREKESNTSVTSSLPNKSFKIRSYTRKMKDGKQEESCEIFQKVDRVRNCRTNSNRIQLFNLSRENREKDESQQRIQTKIRQILQREATIKCKANNQIFVKQPPKLAPSPAMNYQQLNTEKYREMAHKVNVYFNPLSDDPSQKKTLLIVSLEGLTIQTKRIIKNNNTSFEEPARNIEKTSNFSQQQVELLKMLSSKHYPDAIWKSNKLAFKVNTPQEMQQLKNVLQNNHINDYFCIFYPIKKYVECWNLYQIDGLLNHTTSLILLQAKHKLKKEFPIINSQANMLFVVTNNDNFVILSRTLTAIKCFLSQKQKLSQPIQDVDEENCESADDQQKQEERLKNSEIRISQFGLRKEQIDINWKELDSRLQFTTNSQKMKNICRNQSKLGYSNKERSKRRVLCERDNNCPMTASKNNRIMCFNSASVDDKWQIQLPKQQSIDTIKQNLLFCLRTQRLKEVQNQNQNKVGKSMQFMESKGQKGDQLDEITNYVRGSFCRSKTSHQLISELLKKNTTIHRQIQQYISTVGHLIQPLTTNSNNKSVSVFNDQTQEEFPSYQQKTQMPIICAYKIL